jgi:hypothetical protein
MLTAPHYGPGEGASASFFSWANGVFGSVVLLYISGLAEKVTIPSSKFTLAPAQFSTFQALFPKGFEMPSLQVQYLEDELGLVSLFHRIWQSSAVGRFKEKDSGAGGHGAAFEELGKLAATALYSPARMIGYNGVRLEIPLPTGLEVWPAVFPAEVAVDPANKGGNNLSKVTVTYWRIPVWSLSGNIYEWDPGEGGEKITVPGAWGSKGQAAVEASGAPELVEVPEVAEVVEG